MPLRNTNIVAFVPTKKPSGSPFGFSNQSSACALLSDDQFALVFDVGGRMLRVAKVADFTPAPFTVLGWEVADIKNPPPKSWRKKESAFSGSKD